MTDEIPTQSSTKKPNRLSGARHTGRRPNEARRQMVKVLYESGMSVRAIALQIGTTYQAVHSLLQRAGVARRTRGGNTGAHSRHR